MTDNAETSHGDIYADAVELLTTAARRRDASGNPSDFADFIAHVLAATAANLGGPDNLLAGRPGSWEAELVYSLVEGTMGEEPTDWLAHRTEPLVIPLNVAELIETHPDHDGLLGLDDAIDGIYSRASNPEGGESPLSDHSLDALGAQLDAIEIRYRTEFRFYADEFTDAIHAEADRLGIRWAINVQTDTDPESGWWESPGIHNPHSLFADQTDPIAAELWDKAHDVTALPNVDIQVSRSQLP